MENSPTTNFVTINNLALSYELPVNSNINSIGCLSYLEEIEQIDLLPFSKGNIHFSSDLWDFKNYSTTNISKSSLVFIFQGIPVNFKKIVKWYSLISLLNNRVKIQTISARITNLRRCFVYLSAQGIRSVSDITLDSIEKFINYLKVNKKLAITTIKIYKNTLRDFLKFYNININPLNNDELFAYLATNDTNAYEAWRNTHKSKEIPKWYYDKMLVGFIKYMNDPICPYWIQGPSCIYILLSQVGLRIGEILNLSYSKCIKSKEAFNGDKLYY